MIEFLQIFGAAAGAIAAIAGAVAWYSATIRAQVGRERDMNHLFNNHRQQTEAIKILQDDIESLGHELKAIKDDLHELTILLKFRCEVPTGFPQSGDSR